jgi:hypothetical protein
VSTPANKIRLALDPADMWDELVGSGMSEDQATARVAEKFGPPPGQRAAIPTGNAPPPTRDRLPGSGLLRSVNQGASLGWSDELAGLGAAAIAASPLGLNKNPVKAYRDRVTEEREALGEYKAEHPRRAMVGEVGGAIGGGVAASLLSGGALLPAMTANLGRTVASGAAAGAVAGAGADEGGPIDRLGGVVKGGAVGAAFPLVAKPLLAAGQAVGGLLGRITTGIGGDAIEAAQERITGTLGRGLRKVGADRMARRVEGATPFTTADERANDALLNRMEMDEASVPGYKPERYTPEVIALRARASDRPTSILYEGGENVRGLGSAVATTSGPGRNMLSDPLQQRVRDQTKYLTRDAQSAFGMKREDIFRTADDLKAARKARADEHYGKARDAIVEDEEVAELLGVPAFRKVYEQADEVARIRGEDPLPAIYAEDGSTWAIRGIPVGALDRVKRYLDSSIKSGIDSDNGRTRDVAFALRDRLGKLLDRVDELVPEYGKARSIYRGDSEVMEALEQGRNWLKVDDPRLLQRWMADPKRSEGEIELFQRGAMDAFIERMRDVKMTRDVADALFEDEKLLDSIRIVFGDDALNTFMRGVDTERLPALARNQVLRGSDTARKLQDQGQADAETLGLLAKAVVNPLDAARQAGGRAIGRLSGLTPKTSERLGFKLTQGLNDPKDLEALMYELAAHAARRERGGSGPRRAYLLGGSALGGLAAGS